MSDLRPFQRSDAMATLVDQTVTQRYDDLPMSAIAATKKFILDSVGVAFAGTLAPGVPEMLRVLRTWGGAEESTVIALGGMLPTWAAAMMNSFLMHDQEFDCIHDRAVVHPFTTVLPVALAVAERKGRVSGRDLLLSVVLGVDLACSLGIASRSAMRHFRPGTAGAFGAVAAAGKILGFDAPTLADAMGVVYSQICGTLQSHHEGAVVNSMQTAFNARAAVTAVSLASEGVSGPRDVLEGKYGYLRLFEGEYDLGEVLEGLGRVWHVERVSHKPYPCGRLTHGVVEAALRLRSLHQITADQVASCRAVVPPLVHRLVGRPPRLVPGPSAAQDAKLSIPFVVGTALCRGEVFVHDFQGAALVDPAVRKLATQVEVVPDLTISDENAIGPIGLQIRLNDGTSHETSVLAARGSPENPLSHEDHLEKFRRCWEAGAPSTISDRHTRVAEAIHDLEHVDDVTQIIRMVAPSQPTLGA